MRSALLLLILFAPAFGFLVYSPNRYSGKYTRIVAVQSISAEDVVSAVEAAEKLWEEAHEARKTANALSDRAEEEAEAASSLAVETEAKMREGAISLEKISGVDAATMANIDANSMVSKALAANEEADELEALAEEKLKESEELLDKHLEEFPDSPLA